MTSFHLLSSRCTCVLIAVNYLTGQSFSVPERKAAVDVGLCCALDNKKNSGIIFATVCNSFLVFGCVVVCQTVTVSLQVFSHKWLRSLFKGRFIATGLSVGSRRAAIN
jgi:hypothetical protein